MALRCPAKEIRALDILTHTTFECITSFELDDNYCSFLDSFKAKRGRESLVIDIAKLIQAVEDQHEISPLTSLF